MAGPFLGDANRHRRVRFGRSQHFIDKRARDAHDIKQPLLGQRMNKCPRGIPAIEEPERPAISGQQPPQGLEVRQR